MSWDDTVDQLVAAALDAPSFAALLRRLPNVYPSDALRSLERLRNRGCEVPVFDVAAEVVADENVRLPTPHPLDYEWRYTPGTRETLSKVLNEVAPTGTLVLLGAPSMFVTHRGSQVVHLLDGNEALRQYLPDDGRWHRLDLLADELPTLSADVVLADPPWYPEHLGAFVIAAAELLQTTGTLLLSLPGVGTRPGIEEELAALYEVAASAGLEHVSTTPGVLSYEIPQFERNALAAAGISLDVPWRAGDLARFRKTTTSALRRTRSRQLAWQEYRFGSMRVRVQPPTDDEGDPRLISIIPGDVLPTVSRRDERRRDARVWTSGNRIFTVKSLRTLHQILKELQAEQPVRTTDSQVAAAVAQITRLIEVEQTENRRHDGSGT